MAGRVSREACKTNMQEAYLQGLLQSTVKQMKKKEGQDRGRSEAIIKSYMKPKLRLQPICKQRLTELIQVAVRYPDLHTPVATSHQVRVIWRRTQR